MRLFHKIESQGYLEKQDGESHKVSTFLESLEKALMHCTPTGYCSFYLGLAFTRVAACKQLGCSQGYVGCAGG